MFLTDLRQTPPTQSQPETPLQSELLPELTGSAQSPPGEHIVTPPSTVDTAALSEEPLPGEDGVGFKPHHWRVWSCSNRPILTFLKVIFWTLGFYCSVSSLVISGRFYFSARLSQSQSSRAQNRLHVCGLFPLIYFRVSVTLAARWALLCKTVFTGCTGDVWAVRGNQTPKSFTNQPVYRNTRKNIFEVRAAE